MSSRTWTSHRRSAERAISKAITELHVAIGTVMPHPEAASMDAAAKALAPVRTLLELTSPEPEGHSKQVLALLAEKRAEKARR